MRIRSAIIVFFSLVIFQYNLQAQNIFGLATPLSLEPDTTQVFLTDYFTDLKKITGISSIPGCSTQYDPKTGRLTVISSRLSDPLTTCTISCKDSSYTLLFKRSRKEKITFHFAETSTAYQTVSLVGQMSNWNPNLLPMQKSNDVWEITLILNPGTYQYQIVADGNWMLDPEAESAPNGIGGMNSVLHVGNTDPDALPFLCTREIKSDAAATKKYIGISSDRADKDHLIVLWNNTRMNNVRWQNSTALNRELAYIEIPAEAKNTKRSWIRAYTFNDAGLSNDLLIPLEYGEVVTDPSLLERDDLQRSIIYFMMVDRFKNGNKKNDKPVNDKRVDARANYQGGDLAGIQQCIDNGYFTKLGVNALWISPVCQNPWNAYQEYPEPHRWFSGYHGYWPISLSQVDKRFGDNDQFKQLVDDAHTHAFSVYLDYVANHIHEQHPLWKEHPDWFTQLDLPDGRKNLRLWDEYRLTTWFEPYMPSFDYSKPEVVEACTDSAMFWMNTFGLDGFRHDATKHIDTEFWRALTEKIRTEVEIPQHRSIYQIGETFGSRELIASYIGSGLLNAQFDFELYFSVRPVFALDAVSFTNASNSLRETFAYFGYHHLMGNITGNQDMARFISYASGDLKFDENDKEAGWQRDIEVTDTIGYARLKMLQAFNMTIPGIPIIYYGDEIGMPGANDPDNRRMMRFEKLSPQELSVRNTVSRLTHIRSEHMALLYGDIEILSATDDILVYRRTYFSDVVYVFFNKSRSKNVIQIPASWHLENGNAQFGAAYDKAKAAITLGPVSFEVITIDK